MIPLRNRTSLAVAELKEATAIIVKNHYLHRGRTMAQLAYWIMLDNVRSGVLLFSYPRMSVTFRGYKPMELLELARLWIDPSAQGVEVTDSDGRRHTLALASCAIGKALRRIRNDWTTKYPNLPRPLAVVSWSDLEHHDGTVYKAANFRATGISGGATHSAGRRRNGGRYHAHSDYANLKRAFVYAFQARRAVPRG